MQDSLGFWIPRCGFLIPGIEFRIPCQWNLDSGFQSLAGFRISWAEFRIPKSRISNSTRTNSTVEFGFHKQNFPDSGIRITLHGVMCTLNVLSLLGEFSCKYHALKGFDHKIWLKFTSFSIKYLLEEFLMCSFVRWGFLKGLWMPRPDIFIHNILNFLRHLGTETYGTLPWQFCNFTSEIIN